MKLEASCEKLINVALYAVAQLLVPRDYKGTLEVVQTITTYDLMIPSPPVYSATVVNRLRFHINDDVKVELHKLLIPYPFADWDMCINAGYYNGVIYYHSFQWGG